MSLNFHWINKKTGKRLAKINISYTIDRDDLVKGTVIALTDALLTEKETEEKYREVAANLTRAKAEAGIRSLVRTYGEVSLESSSDYTVIDWELEDLVKELAEQTVTRLFPELETT